MLRISVNGATTIPFGSSTPCCIPASNETARPSGTSTTASTANPPERPLLADIVAASDYPIRVSALVERIGSSTAQSDVLALLRACATALGAESALFVSFVRDNEDVSACRFMLACEPQWCQQYLDGGFIAHDPWLAYAAHHCEPIAASGLARADSEGQRVVELACRHGFASAALVPAHTGAGHSRISLLCLGSSQVGFFEGAGFGRFRLGARLLAAELHDWWLTRLRHELILKAHMSTADLELLLHEVRGHSSKQIAAELRVSETSINSRFQRMLVKLGVPNRRMAARLALECGLLLV
jgi:DNA-binding CsgD family transcriptional regulator